MRGARDLMGRFQPSQKRFGRARLDSAVTTAPSKCQDNGTRLVAQDKIEASQAAPAETRPFPPMTMESTFQMIVAAASPHEVGVKTRCMRRRSLEETNGDQEVTKSKSATVSNKEQRSSPPKTNPTKRSLAQMNEDYETVQLDPATSSIKKQKLSPLNTQVSSDTAGSPPETPDTETSRDTPTSPTETSQASTYARQKTKSYLKPGRRTKLKIQLSQALDRARRGEDRADKAEKLLILADNQDPQRLKLGIFRCIKEELAEKSSQIEHLSLRAEDLDLKIAAQKGQLQAHIDWEKTYKASLAEKDKDFEAEKALVNEHLKIIVERNGILYQKDQITLRLQKELDASRTAAVEASKKVRILQAAQGQYTNAMAEKNKEIKALKAQLEIQTKELAKKDKMMQKSVKSAIEKIWEV